jgi:hypothetical protein
MSYTPEFSMKSSVSVRRLSWALGLPMTKTVETMVDILPHIFTPKKVCARCKDTKRCFECSFAYPEKGESLARRFLELM